MVETYAVEASLDWKSNVPQLLKQMLSGFDEVNRAIGGMRDSLGELGSGAKGIGSIVRQLKGLKIPTQALDDIRTLREATGGLADAQRALAESAVTTARAWREIADASRHVRVPTGGGRAGGGHRGWHVSGMDLAMGAQMAGDTGVGLLTRSFHAQADVQIEQELAQSDKKVSDAVLARANALVATLRKQYPALTTGEGLKLFRNTMGIFGDPDESLSALPGAVRLQQLYQLAPLHRGGGGGDAAEVQAAEKAGDIMGQFVDPRTRKLDVGLYQQFMDFQARSYQAGGGLVDAKNWLSFARTSRSAGIGLNQRALEEAQALLEISPGRTGTALMSAFQVFGATTRHMTKGNRAAWQQAGLLGKTGNIIDQQLYQSDPFEWVWKDMLPALKKRGISTRDQILRWLTENGQRGTVAGLLSDIAVNQTPITNTASKMERQDTKLVDKLENSDIGKLAALSSAENNFFIALGKFAEGPGIQLLTALTTGLNKLTDEMNAHPDLSKNIVLVGGGLAILAKLGGDAGMAYLFVGSPFIQGMQALSGTLPGVAAGVAKLVAAAGAKLAPGVTAPTAENPWGAVEGWGAAALRWAGRAASSVGVGVLGWEYGKYVATSPEWQALGDRLQKSVDDFREKHVPQQLHATINVNVDGKKVQTTTTTTPVQSGITGHDIRLGAYPAGLAAGGG